jgi:hypothetical protein
MRSALKPLEETVAPFDLRARISIDPHDAAEEVGRQWYCRPRSTHVDVTLSP